MKEICDIIGVGWLKNIPVLNLRVEYICLNIKFRNDIKKATFFFSVEYKDKSQMYHKRNGKDARSHRDKIELPTKTETIEVFTSQITLYICMYISSWIIFAQQDNHFMSWIILSTLKMGYMKSPHCTRESSVSSVPQGQ